MRTVFLLLAFMLVGGAVQAEDCKPPALSHQAYWIVRPFMELRIKQVREQYTEDGLWRAESRYTPKVNKWFNAILRDRSDAGNEAVAYLLNIYMGIGDSERLVCNAIDRGSSMLPLLKTFNQCRPEIGLEPLPTLVIGSGFFGQQAEGCLAKGEMCPYEQRTPTTPDDLGPIVPFPARP
jgi:hypothetical protein